MTTRKKTPPTELGIYADQLRDAITIVKPFIGVDDTLPMLRGYRFEVHGGDLYVMGTDRYTLAVARVVADDEPTFPAGFTAFVPATLAARALLLFKPPRKSTGLRALLTIATHGGYTSISNVPRDEKPPMRLVGAAQDGFPASRSLLAKTIRDWQEAQKANEAAPTLGLDPAFLARFAVVKKVLGIGTPVVWRAQAHNKPLIVTAGDAFFGMQMPVRLYNSEPGEFEAWAERFTDPEPAAEKKPPARKTPAKKATTRRAKSA